MPETTEAEALTQDIKALKQEIAKMKDGSRLRGYILLALSSLMLPIALTLASTSYSYTQKVGDNSVVVFETKGWIGDLKDIIGILAPVLAGGAIGTGVLADLRKRKESSP